MASIELLWHLMSKKLGRDSSLGVGRLEVFLIFIRNKHSKSLHGNGYLINFQNSLLDYFR